VLYVHDDDRDVVGTTVFDGKGNEPVGCHVCGICRSHGAVDEVVRYVRTQAVRAEQEAVTRLDLPDRQVGRPAVCSAVEPTGQPFSEPRHRAGVGDQVVVVVVLGDLNGLPISGSVAGQAVDAGIPDVGDDGRRVGPQHGHERGSHPGQLWLGVDPSPYRVVRQADGPSEAARVVRVPWKLAALKGTLEFGPPKSAAGARTVALPRAAADALAGHLAGEFVGNGPEALIFTGNKGALLRSGNFGRATSWPTTVTKVGLPAGFHFHDLRHTGNTIAAASGASTRELMQRMGHASMRAALIYQHATSERDREIADGMDRRIADATGRKPKKKGKRRKRPDARFWPVNGPQDRTGLTPG